MFHQAVLNPLFLPESLCFGFSWGDIFWMYLQIGWVTGTSVCVSRYHSLLCKFTRVISLLSSSRMKADTWMDSVFHFGKNKKSNVWLHRTDRNRRLMRMEIVPKKKYGPLFKIGAEIVLRAAHPSCHLGTESFWKFHPRVMVGKPETGGSWLPNYQFDDNKNNRGRPWETSPREGNS